MESVLSESDLTILVLQMNEQLFKREFAVALMYCNKIIDLSSSQYAVYYRWRADIYSDMYRFDRSVEDMTRAVELDPNDARNHWLLGGYVLSNELRINGSIHNCDRNFLKKNVLDRYKTALSLDASDAACFINYLEICVVLMEWDEAVAVYGQCEPYVAIPKYYMAIRAFLGCIALVFLDEAMEPYDLAPLLDTGLTINSYQYRFGEVEDLISSYIKNGKDKDKVKKISYLRECFLAHFVDTPRSTY